MLALDHNAPPKVLEIGEAPIMHEGFPHTTKTYISGRTASTQFPVVSLRTLPQLKRDLADPSFDLVVAHPRSESPWGLDAVVRSVFRRSAVRGDIRVFDRFGPQLLRARVAAPIAVVDHADTPVIFRHNGFMLDRATLYFKRELPPDHWRLFMGTMHVRVPTPRFRLIEKNIRRIAKVRPITLGISERHIARLAARQVPWSEKSIDIFFAGRVQGSSTLRERGMKELLTLRSKGLSVEIPDRRLDRNEYFASCARARMVWSPEGLGWDCFRAYEAALCGAVPLLNRQTIERYRPLRDGVHAIYYDPEPNELASAVESALRDRERLAGVAAAARAHVLAHHTHAAIAHYVVETTLAAAELSRQIAGRED
jgi:glycosyltransferase involved in cell wall biosynthesis